MKYLNYKNRLHLATGSSLSSKMKGIELTGVNPVSPFWRQLIANSFSIMGHFLPHGHIFKHVNITCHLTLSSSKINRTMIMQTKKLYDSAMKKFVSCALRPSLVAIDLPGAKRYLKRKLSTWTSNCLAVRWGRYSYWTSFLTGIL